MKKVIIVEDNLLISVLYKHYLKKLNYKIIADFTTGEEAIDFVKSEVVDLIIMDIMLDGEMDGVETMIEIRKAVSAPVIFASSNSDDLNYKRATEISNSIFLVKPVAECDFLQTVKNVEEA
jgi:DNA-binding response OmpR family regulator